MSSRVVSAWLAALALACLDAPPAAAQSGSTEAVLLLSPAHVENAAQRSEIARGLRSAGLLALQVADLSLELDPVLAACRQPECAAEAASASGKAALLVQVQRSPHAAAALVELFWQDPSGAIFRERAGTAPNKLGSAVGALARRVLQRRVLGERALLQVATSPVGAAVFVDGQLAGVTPFEQAWDAGMHEVRVELSGFASQSARVRLAAGDQHRLDLALPRRLKEPLRGGGSAASPLNFVLAGALAVASIPLLIAGINGALNDGQCIASTSAGCERPHAGAREALLIGGGVVALGASAVLFAARPLRVQLEAAPRALGLRVAGDL